jgi:hypothetical protein
MHNSSVTGCREGCAQDSIDGEDVRGFTVRAGGGLGGREPRAAGPLDVFVRPENAEEGNRENRQRKVTRPGQAVLHRMKPNCDIVCQKVFVLYRCHYSPCNSRRSWARTTRLPR